ncbi:MAG: tetratricopeptide repeat protein [Nitrospira sp.]|nr:tetratricopeptide repeat protein [Nitrospira sp.]
MLALTVALTPSGASGSLSEPERVTNHPALEYAGSPSADGRFLAFVLEQNGNTDIYLKSLTASISSLPHPLTTHPGKDTAPALNENGSSLLYVSYRSDPRGDIYLFDVPTGKETRLTDEGHGELAPAWGQDHMIYFLQEQESTGNRRLVRMSLKTGKVEPLIEHVTSYAVGPTGTIVYSDGRKLLVRSSSTANPRPLTNGDFVDTSPAFADETTIVFTRYQEDTNHDGTIDADDESSIYLGSWNFATGEPKSLYRLTPGGSFHAYPAAAGPYVYYSDLKKKDLYRLNLKEFLAAYSDVTRARESAAILLDRGKTEAALLVLSNLSANVVPLLPAAERASFDMELVELLREARRYGIAKDILTRYASVEGHTGAVARIMLPVVRLEERASLMSPRELTRAVEETSRELLAIAAQAGQDDTVRGTAYLEIGRARLLTNDPLTALDALVQADSVLDNDLRARAQFTRAILYRRLGERDKLLNIFLDVITVFGERSFWGRRAVAQAVSITDDQEDFRKAIASLTTVAENHRSLPFLAASALLRAADRAHEQGELLRAIELLDQVIQDFSSQTALVADAYGKKGTILSSAQRFDEAAQAYESLVHMTGRSREELERAKTLMVLQWVHSALRKRELGEARIAAKDLRKLVEVYPDSVEAHRGYIETKVMLKEFDDVRRFYEDLVTRVPDHPASRYGLGLALSYAPQPDLNLVIKTIEQAVQLNSKVSYFHQTLGWAYEQAERMGVGNALERAEKEYRLALELNDRFLFPDVENHLLLNLGNIYMKLGNYTEAYRHYARRQVGETLERDRLRELLYHKNYGEACFKTGRTEESIAQYERTLTLVPNDQPQLRAEVLERLGLSQQEAGRYAQAVQSFSEALAINGRLGLTDNLTRLSRNIGVNLYNLGATASQESRSSLKQALKRLLESLDFIDRFGVAEKATGPGLFHIQAGLSGGASEAATGFDRRGEEKLLFSFIARTYEDLSEPQPAKDYYAKKLALIQTAGDSPQAVAARAEEAVVLNRLAVLSHALGQTDETIQYLERSLARTRELGLDYGMKVNLYNLSRLAVERRMTGDTIEPRLIEILTEGVHTVLRDQKPDRLTVFLLSNTAFVLAGIQETRSIAEQPLELAVEEMHRVLRAHQDSVFFLKKALDLIEHNKILIGEEADYLTLALTLNLWDLATEAGHSPSLEELGTRITSLATKRPSPHAWPPLFLRAERTPDVEQRASLLVAAVNELLDIPAHVFMPLDSFNTIPLMDGLASLTTETLLQRGQVEAAFETSERIAMRKTAMLVAQRLGVDFLLAGIGAYETEFRDILERMKVAVGDGRPQDLRDLNNQFRDLTYALYEEYPWAVSYLREHELPPHILSDVLRPDSPYLRVTPGTHDLHVLLHDGKIVRHLSIPRSRVQSKSLDKTTLPLEKVSVVYLSVPASLHGIVLPLLPEHATIVEVATVYDVLNAYRLRSLFATKAAVAGNGIPVSGKSGEKAGGEDTIVRLTGNRDHDIPLLENRHIVVTTGPFEGGGFVIGSDLAVRDKIPLPVLAGRHRHTAILLNHHVDQETIRLFVAPALIRAGFPHVIAASAASERVAGHRSGQKDPWSLDHVRAFVASYLKFVQHQRIDRAAAAAVQEAADRNESPLFLQLYGFVGMTEQEKASFAESEYQRAVSDAVTAYQAKQFETALRRAEDALSILPLTKNGHDFPKLTELAVETAFKLGEYRTAVRHQSKLVEQIAGTGNRQATAEAQYRLGILYSRLEEFQPALAHLEAAIEQWRTHDELDRLAEAVATLGVVKENMGAYTEALDAFGQSFQLYEELGEPLDVATQYRRIGRINYLRLGRYGQARHHFASALDLYRKQGARRLEAETLYEIGLTFEKTALYDEADRHYAEGRSIGMELQDPALLATGSLYLANTAWYRGRYQEAFDHLEAAAREAERAHDPRLPIMIANTRGLLYWTLNDLDKALVYAEQAVSLAEQAEIKEEIASSHNNLGLMLRERNQIDQALTHFERARQIDEQQQSRWGLGYDHRNIGIALMKLGRLAEARSHFESAERYSAAINNVDNWVKAILELGNVHRETKEYETALDYYRRAYDLSKRYHVKEVLWRAAAGQGSVLRLSGKMAEAVAPYREAVDTVEGMRASLTVEEFRNSFQTKTQDLYRDLVILLIELGRTDDAFNYLERSRSRSFIDLLANQKLNLKTQADQHLLDLVMDLQMKLDALSKEQASYEQPPAELITRVRQAKTAYEEAVVRLKRASPELSTFVAVDPLTVEQVQQLLEPGVGLLSYKVTDDHVYLWLVTASSVRFYQTPTALGEIGRLVRSYRTRVQRVESVSEELSQLSHLLIEPAARDLEGLRYLGIIPDGPLHFLSFAALPLGAGSLIDGYPLFYSPSASVLRFTFAKRTTAKTTKILAIGNPDLGHYNYQLPMAELEARSIRWEFPNLDILTGPLATKEWLLANVSRYGIIHLATHGEFDDVNPLLSSLWLASPNPNNRKLTVREVFGLTLNADLVTLSACQTGLGRLEAGELIGLNRAFMYAGTHTLVSALWRVDDLATSLLMKHFYRNYANLDKAMSLRQAQLLIKKDFPHPAYWSGLVLVGDYR